MTPLILLRKLALELRAVVEKYQLVAQNQNPKKVSVYLQTIPESQFQDDSFYPLVLVEFLGADHDIEYSTAEVLITIGTYDGERTDLIDHFNLITEIQNYLLEHRLLGEFILELPLSLGMVEKTSDNFTFSQIFATYQIPHLYEDAVKI